ncbi:hypothetical protein ES703_32168 [subsurface metagenome]
MLCIEVSRPLRTQPHMVRAQGSIDILPIELFLNNCSLWYLCIHTKILKNQKLKADPLGFEGVLIRGSILYIRFLDLPSHLSY